MNMLSGILIKNDIQMAMFSKMQLKLNNFPPPPFIPHHPLFKSTGRKIVTLEIVSNKIRDTIKASGDAKS